MFKGKWLITWDFRYNKKRIKEHISAAKEFYESAKENLEKNRLRVFIDNSFSAAELSAKSILLIIPDKSILYGTDHEIRKEKFRNWAELGNVKMEYSKTLEWLISLRPSARYLTSIEYKKVQPEKILQSIKEMIVFAETSIK